MPRASADNIPDKTHGRKLLAWERRSMPHSDHYGFDLSTNTTEAAAAYDRGARSFVPWRADAMSHLDAAVEADPDCAVPKLLKAWILHAARTHKFTPAVHSRPRTIDPLPSSLGSARERIDAA